MIAEDEARRGKARQRFDDEVEGLAALRAAVDDVAEKDDPPRIFMACGIRLDGRQQRGQQVAAAMHVADGVGSLACRRHRIRLPAPEPHAGSMPCRPAESDASLTHIKESVGGNGLAGTTLCVSVERV